MAAIGPGPRLGRKARQVKLMNTEDTAHRGLHDATAALRDGRMVLVIDDQSDNVGGYLCAAGSRITPDQVNFMVTHARGHICVAMSDERMHTLAIPMMSAELPFAGQVAYGVSIEANRNVTTGISAADRAETIRCVSRADASTDDIVMPGHVFPIQIKRGGVLVRAGVPEAAFDLVNSVSTGDAVGLCMVLDADGAVADDSALAELAERESLPTVTLSAVVADRLRRDVLVRRAAERTIEVAGAGEFHAIVYHNDLDGMEHIALVAGDIRSVDPIPVRVHSQCLTGDVFGSTRCDCGDQLLLAMQYINRVGAGVIVYMHQEGRGIGLANKIRAYALQDQGRDTVEANLELGFKEDLRDYGLTAQILKDLGVGGVQLLTNNPQKIEGLRRYGVDVRGRDSIQTTPTEENLAYLRTKKAKLGHLLDDRKLGLAGEVSS